MKIWGHRNKGSGKGSAKGAKGAVKHSGAKGTAAKGAAKGAAAKGEERLRVKCGRVPGKVVRWRGEEGWIRPDRAIDHPFKLKNNGEVFIAKKDVAAGVELRPGSLVDFLVYSIKEGGGRLGADFCRLSPPKDGAAAAAAPAKEATGTAAASPLMKVRGSVGASSMLAAAAAKLKTVAAPKGAAKGSPKGAKTAKGEAGAKAGAKGESTRTVLMKPAAKSLVQKNKLKNSGEEKGASKGGKGGRNPEDKERTIVVRIPRLGTITKWLGNYGWVEADQAVDHADAAKNRGKIFLHIRDFDGDAPPKAGIRVTFAVYADQSGLGAAHCKPTQKPEGGAKVIVPKARPMVQRSEGPKEPALPPFWEKHWSEQHKMYYFWNSKTKESKWTKPAK